MATDDVTPLASVTQFRAGGFADLARAYTDDALLDILREATRSCETQCSRRLVPFTSVTETHRAEGIDPDELSGDSNMPMDLQSSLGRSYAMAVGASGNLVRHAWVSEFAPHFPEFWEYTDVTVHITRSFGGGQDVHSGQILSGPDPDSGHIWFQLGLYLPLGSLIKITYSGGYTTVPRDLSRACLYRAAAIVCHELDPKANTTQHSPDRLEKLAEEWLVPWSRYGRGATDGGRWQRGRR